MQKLWNFYEWFLFRLKVKFDTPPGSAKNSISESIKSSKKNSRKKLLKSASESRYIYNLHKIKTEIFLNCLL